MEINIPLDELLRLATHAAKKAGKMIRSESFKAHDVFTKESGDSKASQVVTEVDEKSEAIIYEELYRSCNKYDMGLLTEETPDDLERLEKNYFWCIDPLDGTLSFIEGNAGYSVSIALVDKKGIPLIGVIYDPYEDVLYQAVINKGAKRNGQAFKIKPMRYDLSVYSDRSFRERKDFSKILSEAGSVAQDLKMRGAKERLSGGAVLNACYMLENAPACYFKFPKPHTGGGSLWDYAASACIVKEAGGIALNMFGEKLDLNREDSTFMNHEGICYATSEEISDALVKKFKHWIE